MKQKLIIAFVLVAKMGFCQMQPADSLPGTYAGQYWYANPAGNPWTITNDTFYVQSSIDSINCTYQGWTSQFSIGGSPPANLYYTDYYSCNSPAPSNYYSKFYSGDSVRVIWDNTPQPPPNPPYSMRFYGKRISNLTGIDEKDKTNDILIYPNPTDKTIIIEYKIPDGDALVQIADVYGKLIRGEKLKIKNEHMLIDVSSLKEGIYFLTVKTASGTTGKKIIIQK